MERTSGRFYTIVALLIIAGALSVMLRYVRVQPDRISDFSLIPIEESGWQGKDVPLADWTLDVLKATDNVNRYYTADDGTWASLFIGYFKDQKYGSQIHSPRHCLPGGGWGVISIGPTTVNVAGKNLTVNRAVIGNKKQRQLVYYWYVTRSGLLTSEYGLKFDLMKNAMLFRPTDAALIRVITMADSDDTEKGEQSMIQFLETFLPDIENSLPFQS